MDRYDIKISDLAKQDILDIASYIRDELLEPEIAENMTNTILDSIFKLETLPARIPLVNDERLAKMGIRGLHIKNYTAFFKISESLNIVNIVRVLYSRRNWQAIL